MINTDLKKLRFWIDFRPGVNKIELSVPIDSAF